MKNLILVIFIAIQLTNVTAFTMKGKLGNQQHTQASSEFYCLLTCDQIYYNYRNKIFWSPNENYIATYNQSNSVPPYPHMIGNDCQLFIWPVFNHKNNLAPIISKRFINDNIHNIYWSQNNKSLIVAKLEQPVKYTLTVLDKKCTQYSSEKLLNSDYELLQLRSLYLQRIETKKQFMRESPLIQDSGLTCAEFDLSCNKNLLAYFDKIASSKSQVVVVVYNLNKNEICKKISIPDCSQVYDIKISPLSNWIAISVHKGIYVYKTQAF